MYFIFGGRSQGKLKYALDLYGKGLDHIDLSNSSNKNIFDYDILYNLHEWSKELLIKDIDPIKFFYDNIDCFKGKILIGDEIGSGIVPLDPFDRKWRDVTGWLYQAISKNASRVDRVFAGLGLKLKDIKDEK